METLSRGGWMDALRRSGWIALSRGGWMDALSRVIGGCVK